MKLKKIKSLMFLFSALALICILPICTLQAKVYASADDVTSGNGTEIEEPDEEAVPYSTTTLSLTINSGDGKVWATVKNDFTLFPSTVIVIVQLYSSETYAESYTEMTLVSQNSIDDLNIGKTVKTEAETGGVEKFWLARMRYKINNASWASRDTGACRISASGEFLGFI